MKNEQNKTSVNLKLAEKQNLTEKEIQSIEMLHELRDLLPDISGLRGELTIPKAKALREYTTKVELLLQHLWNFPLDESKHRFWNVPHCTCPKLDNEDRYPDSRVLNQSCLIHGGSSGENKVVYESRIEKFQFEIDGTPREVKCQKTNDGVVMKVRNAGEDVIQFCVRSETAFVMCLAIQECLKVQDSSVQN